MVETDSGDTRSKPCPAWQPASDRLVYPGGGAEPDGCLAGAGTGLLPPVGSRESARAGSRLAAAAVAGDTSPPVTRSAAGQPAQPPATGWSAARAGCAPTAVPPGAVQAAATLAPSGAFASAAIASLFLSCTICHSISIRRSSAQTLSLWAASSARMVCSTWSSSRTALASASLASLSARAEPGDGSARPGREGPARLMCDNRSSRCGRKSGCWKARLERHVTAQSVSSSDGGAANASGLGKSARRKP
eukprot:scaffold4124_cov109-Isochrysis_galbana.AAC.7